MDLKLRGDISKLHEDERLVFGWASVIEKEDGTPVVDSQGDIIESDELEKAAYEFVLEVRKAGEMHQKIDGVGTLVEMVFLSKDKQKAMGIEKAIPVGMWVGFKVNAEIFAKIKSGAYKMFSIGGKGERVNVD